MNFNDFDEYAFSVEHGSIENHILHPVPFRANFIQVITKDILVSYQYANKGLLQKGNGAEAFITFLIPGPDTSFVWRKIQLDQTKCGILINGREHVAITQDNFEGYPVSISKSHFIQEFGKEAFGELITREYIHIGIPDVRTIHNLIKRLCKCPQEEFERSVDYLLSGIMNVLKHVVSQNLSDDNGAISDIHGTHTAKVLDFIHQNLKEISSIKSISQEFGVSERTLRYLFNKEVQTSPKKYVKNLLLNGVRKELKENSRYSSITQVANKWGFWHMSQFSVDYKKLFGVLPSKTIERGPLKS
jgi:AraC-like DNA-binding protein